VPTIDVSSKRYKETSPVDFDVMLEIKDREKSALRAVTAASHDPRFQKAIGNK
jgi:hypothetical protein